MPNSTVPTADAACGLNFEKAGRDLRVIADIAERLDGVKQLLGAAKLAVDGLDSENSEDCTCVGRLLTLICDEVELAKEGVGTAFRSAHALAYPNGPHAVAAGKDRLQATDAGRFCV
jgi:hypothetical protein